MKIKQLIRAVQWIQQINQGEFIRAKNWSPDYLQLPPIITQDDLDGFCKFFNQYVDSTVLITNHMGELIPIKKIKGEHNGR